VFNNVSGSPTLGCSDRDATPSLTANDIKMWVSVNHQFKVHQAPAFLPVVFDVGSPQSALDIDKDTSWQTENVTQSYRLKVYIVMAWGEARNCTISVSSRVLFYT
jgi:hypothetical protein